MQTARSVRATTTLAVVVAAVAAATALLRWATPSGLNPRPGALLHFLATADPTVSVPAALAAVAWLATCWLALGVLTAIAATLPGQLGRLADRAAVLVAPAGVRRLVQFTVGVGVVIGATAGPALADVPPLDRPAATAPAQTRAPAGTIPSLDRPGAPTPAVTALLAPPPRRQGEPAATAPRRPAPVVVRPGDSLWSIVARHLGPGSTPAQVAAAWPRWYAANRAVIGPDPDLLLPGQRLTPPTR